jgi:hypothetical protein
VKRSAEQSSFTDSDDGTIVERCQHFYLWTNRFYGWAANEEGVEWRFSQSGH